MPLFSSINTVSRRKLEKMDGGKVIHVLKFLNSGYFTGLFPHFSKTSELMARE